jgi:superfamily I DNA and RNA helicase
VTGFLRADIADAERQIVSLTERQIAALSLVRNVRRCVIRGGAGTGKTLLALEKARRVAIEGGRALLVCFNAPLASALSNELRGTSGVTVANFHSLCMRLGRASGAVPRNPDDAWFTTRAASVLMDAAETMGDADKYDALVVDEAQDLTDDWLTALTFLLRSMNDGPVLLLLDNHQEIYRGGLSLPPAWPVVELDMNCRNTLPIARRVAACFRDPAPTSGATGPEPHLVVADNGVLARCCGAPAR